MRSLMTLALAVSLCAGAAQAQMVLYEDFESYPVDETIHMKGVDQTDLNPGVDIARWYVQQNSDVLVDHGWSNVRMFGGNKVLEMIANDVDGSQSAGVSTAMSMESMQITGEGTIYVRYAVNDVCDNGMLTNDLEAGWDYDNVAGGTISSDGWQQGASGRGWSDMGAIANIGGGVAFNARDQALGGYVSDTDVNPPILTWIEMWIQVDHANDRTKYFLCEQGEAPVQAMSPGPDGAVNTADDTEWWGMRNETWENDAVQNLKFIISNWGYTDEVSNTVYLDTIGINTSAMTLERVGPAMLPDIFGPTLQADFDGDGDVDLDDFVILKTNFGIVPPADGDADGDGDVDLDDFVILKNEFGS